MPEEFVESLEDPRLDLFRQLKDTNQTRWQGFFITEGEKLTRRLLASSFPVVSILTDQAHRRLAAT